MKEIQLYSKISNLPSEIKGEVIDFIDFLLSKREKGIRQKQPVFGCAQGLISISNDFDDAIDQDINKNCIRTIW